MVTSGSALMFSGNLCWIAFRFSGLLEVLEKQRKTGAEQGKRSVWVPAEENAVLFGG